LKSTVNVVVGFIGIYNGGKIGFAGRGCQFAAFMGDHWMILQLLLEGDNYVVL